MKKILLVLMLFLAACSTTRNVSPPPTMVPPALSQKEVEQAVMLALKDAPRPSQQSLGSAIVDKIFDRAFGDGLSRKQYWYYEGRGDNVVFAGFYHSDYYMRAEVSYSAREVKFRIVDSRNLQQTKYRIHKNALVWLGYLERDVRASLGSLDRLKYEQEQRDGAVK